MKRLAVIIIAAIIIVGITAIPAYARSSGIYIVQPGDTLLKIAARHSISVSQLAEANGLRWNSWVYAGQRLLIPGSQPGSSPAQDTVDGWAGKIVNTPPGSQHAYYFERADGVGFGIGGINDLVGRQIEELRWTGERFLVWGTLRTDVPSYGGQYIAVDSLEVVPAPIAESRNLTPLATVSASSHLRTDRWGQYQAWMATDGALGTAWVEGVAGSGIGEWIELRFPGTVEIHAIRLDIGYDKSADVFYKNNRIKRVTLVFSTGEQIELGFADKRGMQEISLARAPGPAIETTSVKVVIEEVFPGWKYDDTCLAEIEVLGRTK
jgi:LysM repeat protein